MTKTIEIDMLNQPIKVKRATLYNENHIEVVSKIPIEIGNHKLVRELFLLMQDENGYIFENNLLELMLLELKKDDAFNLLIKGLRGLGVIIA